MKKTLFIITLIFLATTVVVLVILNEKKVSIEPIVNNVATTTEDLSFKAGQKMIFVVDKNDSRCHDKDGFPALAFLPKTDSVFVFSNFETRLKEYPILNIEY